MVKAELQFNSCALICPKIGKGVQIEYTASRCRPIKNFLKELPLKFQGESNGAKKFGHINFNLYFTGSGTGSDIIDVGYRLLKDLIDYTLSGHLSTNA